MSQTVDTSLARVQSDPVGENPVAVAYFKQDTVIDGVVFSAPWTSASWPILSDKTITVGDITLSYAQVSALLTAIAYQEKRDQAQVAAPSE